MSALHPFPKSRCLLGRVRLLVTSSVVSSCRCWTFGGPCTLRCILLTISPYQIFSWCFRCWTGCLDLSLLSYFIPFNGSPSPFFDTTWLGNGRMYLVVLFTRMPWFHGTTLLSYYDVQSLLGFQNTQYRHDQCLHSFLPVLLTVKNVKLDKW